MNFFESWCPLLSNGIIPPLRLRSVVRHNFQNICIKSLSPLPQLDASFFASLYLVFLSPFRALIFILLQSPSTCTLNSRIMFHQVCIRVCVCVCV